MKSSNILNVLKEIYYSIYNQSMVERKVVCGILLECKTEDNNVVILKDILDSILTSNNISIQGKTFIKNLEYTRVDVCNSMYRMTGKKECYKTTCDNITADKKILDKCLGAKVLMGIIKNEEYNTNEINKALESINSNRYKGNKSYKGNLAIHIDTSEVNIVSIDTSRNRYRDDEQLREMLESLEPYLKVRMRILSEAINEDKEFVEYFSYLLSSRDKDNTDERNSIILKRFLTNEDYSEEALKEIEINKKEYEDKDTKVEKRKGGLEDNTPVEQVESNKQTSNDNDVNNMELNKMNGEQLKGMLNVLK